MQVTISPTVPRQPACTAAQAPVRRSPSKMGTAVSGFDAEKNVWQIGRKRVGAFGIRLSAAGFYNAHFGSVNLRDRHQTPSSAEETQKAATVFMYVLSRMHRQSQRD
ncbi:MAG: hypothetical protein WKF84_29890 [Pyrinomonadaceae bacterium]